AGAQTIRASSFSIYYNLNASTTGIKTLGNTLNVNNNLTVQGTAVLDVDVTKNYAINVGGNWTISSTNVAPFLPENGTVTFNGSSGTQALSAAAAAGETFYNLTINNTSTTSPGLTTTQNINVTHNTTFT